jgi:hypothetical protein
MTHPFDALEWPGNMGLATELTAEQVAEDTYYNDSLTAKFNEDGDLVIKLSIEGEVEIPAEVFRSHYVGSDQVTKMFVERMLLDLRELMPAMSFKISEALK